MTHAGRILSPYDKGEVLEPLLWVATGNAAPLDPAINPHAEEKIRRHGYVDFDDEEKRTVATVRIVRNPEGSDTDYTLEISGDPGEVDIKWLT